MAHGLGITAPTEAGGGIAGLPLFPTIEKACRLPPGGGRVVPRARSVRCTLQREHIGPAMRPPPSSPTNPPHFIARHPTPPRTRGRVVTQLPRLRRCCSAGVSQGGRSGGRAASRCLAFTPPPAEAAGRRKRTHGRFPHHTLLPTQEISRNKFPFLVSRWYRVFLRQPRLALSTQGEEAM